MRRVRVVLTVRAQSEAHSEGLHAFTKTYGSSDVGVTGAWPWQFAACAISVMSQRLKKTCNTEDANGEIMVRLEGGKER